MLNDLMFAVFNAAAFGMAIFLVAAGLTLIFGLLRLLNMAQGGFFMIGAYTAYSVMGRDVQSIGMFLLGVLAGGVVVALLGLVTDRLVLRRLRNVDPHYVLIATFALMMVCTGVTKLIWGVDFFSVYDAFGRAVQTVVYIKVETGSLSVNRLGAGVALGLGADWQLDRRWRLNLDLRHVTAKPNLSAQGGQVGSLQAGATRWSLGAGRDF